VLDCEEIENWIRVSEPPPFGLTLSNPEFQVDIRGALDAFRPDCVIFDPWNATVKDDKQRDYIETFEALRNLLPTGKDKPALGIVAHTHKPQMNEKRTGGTGLMHLLAGSYVLTSVPRSIFVMVRGLRMKRTIPSCCLILKTPMANTPRIPHGTGWRADSRRRLILIGRNSTNRQTNERSSR